MMPVPPLMADRGLRADSGSLALGTHLRFAGVVAAALLLTGLLIAVTLSAAATTPALVILPLVAVVLLIAGLILYQACLGNRRALIGMLMTLVFVNDALFRVREPGDIGLDWQNAMKFALWGSAGLIGVCHWRSALPVWRTGAARWLLVYLGYALLSSIYSASPMYSFGTSFGLLSMALFAAALASTLKERDILLPFALSLWLFVLAGWVVYYAVPDLGRSLFITAQNTVVERICGLAGQANALGCSLAVLLAITFLMWQRGMIGLRLAVLLGGTAFFTLMVADSRTSLLAVAAGVFAVLLRRSLWRVALAMLGTAGLAVLLIVTPVSSLLRITGGLSRSGDPTELFTLTGRTDIWEFAWDKIVLNPWVGYGYNSSKFILPQFDGLPGLQIDEAHNMLLQNLLAVGVVGTIPLLLLFVQMITDFVRRPYAGRDVFTFLDLIWGITVAGAFGSTPTVMSLATFCGIAMAARARAQTAPARPVLSTLPVLARV
jgi:O-antigen ligase